jgi:hypothetical protein
MQNLHKPFFTPAMSESTWRLDASRLPQRVDLDIPAEIHALLEQRSLRSGRSVRDLVEELIHRSPLR